LILYLDTSALVKRYFEEPYSNKVAEQWQAADEIATSSVAYAEALASFHRKSREAVLDAEILDDISNNLLSNSSVSIGSWPKPPSRKV
jgi:predicted nucleic acid-binding protein